MFCVSYIAVIVCDREAQRSEPPPGSELIRLGGSANGCAHMTHANELLGQFRARSRFSASSQSGKTVGHPPPSGNRGAHHDRGRNRWVQLEVPRSTVGRSCTVHVTWRGRRNLHHVTDTFYVSFSPVLKLAATLRTRNNAIKATGFAFWARVALG